MRMLTDDGRSAETMPEIEKTEIKASQEEVVSRYKAAYAIVFETTKKFFSHYPLVRIVSFITSLENQIKDAYRADKQFPAVFCQEMCHWVIRWAMDDFCDVTRDDLPKIFNQAWNFHKRHMFDQNTDEVWDTILNEQNETCKDLCKHAQKLYAAILRELDRQINK